jgi:hypothetical protein
VHLRLRNIGAVSIDLAGARLDLDGLSLVVDTDGPTRIHLVDGARVRRTVEISDAGWYQLTP